MPKTIKYIETEKGIIIPELNLYGSIKQNKTLASIPFPWGKNHIGAKVKITVELLEE